jgi:hypothetical protein
LLSKNRLINNFKNKDEILTVIKDIVLSLLKLKFINEYDHLMDLGIDSIGGNKLSGLLSIELN